MRPSRYARSRFLADLVSEHTVMSHKNDVTTTRPLEKKSGCAAKDLARHASSKPIRAAY